MANRRILGPVEGLRNTRRSLGDGTLGGRSRIATPYDPRRLRRATSSLAAGSATPQGELLAISGTAVTVAGGGSTLASLAETIQAQSGFTSVDSAGDVPTLPLSGSYVAEVDVRWTDGYRGGGTVRVLLAGAGIEEVWPTAHTSEPWCRWVDQVTFAGGLGETFDVEVTPDDGASHTADVTVRLAVVEPLRTVVDNPEVTPELYGIFASDLFVLSANDLSTWTELAEPEVSGTPQGFNAGASSEGTMCVIGGAGRYIFRTQNSRPSVAGDWTQVLNSGDTDLIDIATNNDGVWIATEDTGGIPTGDVDLWRSVDDGENWSVVASITGTPANRAPLSIMWDPGGMFIAVSDGLDYDDIFYSTDDGATWTQWDVSGVQGSSGSRTTPSSINGTTIMIPETGTGVNGNESTDLSTITQTYSPDLDIYGGYTAARTIDGAQWLLAGTITNPGEYAIVTPDSGVATEYDVGIAAEFSAVRNCWAVVNGIMFWINIDSANPGIFYTDDVTSTWTQLDPPSGGTSPSQIFGYQTV